jgi:hypothetical protein
VRRSDTGKGITESFVNSSNRQLKQSFQAICNFMVAINSNFHNFVFLQRKTSWFLITLKMQERCAYSITRDI